MHTAGKNKFAPTVDRQQPVVSGSDQPFAVLAGPVEKRYRQDGEEHRTLLKAGDVFFAGVGCEHVAHPQGEARILVGEHEGSA